MALEFTPDLGASLHITHSICPLINPCASKLTHVQSTQRFHQQNLSNIVEIVQHILLLKTPSG